MKKKTIKAKLAKTEKKLAKVKSKLSVAKSALKTSKENKPAASKAVKPASAIKPAAKKPAAKKPAARRRPLQKKSPFVKPEVISLSELLPDTNGTPVDPQTEEAPETPDDEQFLAA